MRTLGLLLLCLSGCTLPNVERLSRQLSEGGSTFYLEVPTVRGPIKIGRANPALGISAALGPNGVLATHPPTNVAVSVSYTVPMPGMQTNQTQPKPK